MDFKCTDDGLCLSPTLYTGLCGFVLLNSIVVVYLRLSFYLDCHYCHESLMSTIIFNFVARMNDAMLLFIAAPGTFVRLRMRLRRGWAPSLLRGLIIIIIIVPKGQVGLFSPRVDGFATLKQVHILCAHPCP